MSKRRDKCLSGSSPLESPEKVRGMEEFNDNFRIELEDDELQREDMEEKEMEDMEMEEKEREEDVEVEQRKEEGKLPFRIPKPKPPFSNQQGFTCTCCLSNNDDTAYPFCVCCSVKVS